MSIVLLVYLASIVESVKTTTGVMAVVFIFILGVYALFTIMYNGDQEKEEFKHKMKHVKKTISSILFLGCVSIFTPTEKTIYLMAGASIAQDIANNPKTIEVFDKVYQVVNKKLDEQLTEKEKNK